MTEIYYEYVLGPIVDHTDEIEGEGLYMIRIEGGSYAVFQTERESDRENMEDTIRMFARCVYFGWIQENMEKVDFNRYTFERYLNDKIFVYVPVHNLKKKGKFINAEKSQEVYEKKHFRVLYNKRYNP